MAANSVGRQSEDTAGMADPTNSSDQRTPLTFDACYKAGIAYVDKKRFADADAALRKALSLNPTHLGAQLKLATALMQQSKFGQSIELLCSTARLYPNTAEVHGMLGNAYALAGVLDPAVNSFRRTVALNPNLGVAHFGLGSALAHQGKAAESIPAFREAIRLNYPAAHCNLGVALALVGELEPAAAELREAIALNPDDAVAHWNFGILMLLQGNWRDGWLEYEWRWRWNLFPSARRDFKLPEWRGQEIGGQTLLIHAEQGFGDTIQFIRYLPLVAARGARIIMECQPELLPLFRKIPGDQTWVRAGDPLPAFSIHCPMASLPGIFGTTPQAVPAQTPPLCAPADRIESWKSRLGPGDGRRRVGIAWAGRSTFKGDHTRSLRLEQLQQILAMDNFIFYSLQKGPPAEQIQQLNPPGRLIDLGPQLRDFADTAAVMSLCDLIVTTDTSIPHLAGAMDRPVWVMLQYVPDWRWLLGREDSPWYPSARLFRQPSLGDWPGVTARVADALMKL
jgi:tetratricopeptide (TPR) repeat protein